MKSGNMEKKLQKESVKPRRTLDLEERIAVIQSFEKNGESMRVLALKYNCSLTQIKNVVRRKEEYMHEWNNQGDLAAVRKKQAMCFLSVGAVVCEFIHRWKVYSQKITDDLLLVKGQEVSALLNTPEIRTTTYWLARIKKKFKIFDPPMYSTPKSLQMSDIILDLMDSYSPDSKKPQLLSYEIIKRYTKEIEQDNHSVNSRLSKTDSVSLSSESSTDISYINDDYGILEKSANAESPIIVQQETILEGSIDITDVDDDSEEDFKENFDVKAECVGTSNANEVCSYAEALNQLAPVEQFVMLQADTRAIGLLNQLEVLFKDKIKNSHGV